MLQAHPINMTDADVLSKNMYISPSNNVHIPSVTVHKTRCDTVCLKAKKIMSGDKKQYDVFHKPSDVLIKDNMNTLYKYKMYNLAPVAFSNIKTTMSMLQFEPLSVTNEYNINANPKQFSQEKLNLYISDNRETMKRKENSVQNKEQENRTVHGRLQYIRNHAPEEQTKNTEQRQNINSSETSVDNRDDISINPLDLSSGDRVDFQIQGHKGPSTYIFGFDTGNGKSRQYRLEEKLKDGTVNGHYAYYDAHGKLRIVKYSAKPFAGYQERHHETRIFNPMK